MAEGDTWLSCLRHVIVAAEQAYYAGRQWRGARMTGFRRWVGMDHGLHAAVVLADGTRVILDEDQTPRAPPHQGSEHAVPFRRY
jgi:hypothetical protein